MYEVSDSRKDGGDGVSGWLGGWSFADTFHSIDGARVILVARREAELVSAAAEIGSRATYSAHDINWLERAPELGLGATQAAGGPISILVNNAGIHIKKSVIETTSQDFQSELDTPILAAHALNRAVLPGMLSRNGGSILLITSMAAFMGVPLVIAFSAAKSACTGMTRPLAAEVSPHGVRQRDRTGVDRISMLRKAFAGDRRRTEKMLSRTPNGGFGVPANTGWAAVYLCSTAARFCDRRSSAGGWRSLHRFLATR